MILWTLPGNLKAWTTCAQDVDEAAHAESLLADGLIPAGATWEIVPDLPADIAAALAAQAATRKALDDGIAADTATLKADNALRALMKASPAQIDTWVTNNVTDLAGARVAIKMLAKAVSVLARARLES